MPLADFQSTQLGLQPQNFIYSLTKTKKKQLQKDNPKYNSVCVKKVKRWYEEYSDDGDGQVGLGKVYKNMAQSQSNYMPGKIRSVKEIQSTFDFNTEEQLVIVELIEEYTRRGQFDLIFPRKQTVERYKKYFKVQRATNLLVWKWLKLSSNMAVPNPGPTGTDGNQSEQSPVKDKKSQNNRFSVLKDFNLRKTCPEPIIDEIKRL